MARGRMISRTLGSSRKFADLQRTAGKLREFCQALYPLIVANADDFGRMAGDAFTVKMAVFPSSPRTDEEFAAALVAMHHAKLIHLYTDEELQPVIQVVKFDLHQVGLHKRTKSRFSEPPVNFQEIPGTPWNVTGIPSELKRTELKRTEPVRSSKNLTTVEAAESETKNLNVHAFIKAFCDLFKAHRHGASYHVVAQRDVPLVRALLKTYGHERLARMAHLLLVTLDEWIDETDRGIGILSIKASWLDGRLAEAEHEAMAR